MEVTREIQRAPPSGRGEHTLPSTPGPKSYSKEASLQDWRKNLEAPPPGQGSERDKSCQTPGPASPVVLPGPSPPAAEAGAAPPPAQRPLSRPEARALGLLVPLPESRLLPYPAHLRERLRRFSPDPSSGHGSHTLPLVPHSLSLTHTHSATTAPERPTYYASLACYVLCARVTLARGSLAGRGRSAGNIKALLGNEVLRLRAGMVGLDLPVSTTSAH